MTRIVAFTGKRGDGKDTAALALKNIGWTHINFADALREVVKIVYGISYEEMGDAVLKEKVLDRYPFKSPREILTLIGTQGFRDLIAQDTWVEAFTREAQLREYVVCSDLRFLNEEKKLKELGGTIIRVVNPRRKHTDATSQHRSETEMDSIVPHHTILNDADIPSLHAKVLAVINE